jgi:hypothetical protein
MSELVSVLFRHQTFFFSIYRVLQNSRNNSVGQCQLMLENYEKNYKKILNHSGLKIWGSKGATLISFILNIKKDFDDWFFTSQ